MVCMVFMTLFLVRKLGYRYIDDFLGFLYAWPMNNKDPSCTISGWVLQRM